MKQSLTAPCLLLVSLLCHAQSGAPLLHVSAVRLPGGGFNIVATNNYTAAAEDYVIAHNYYNTKDTQCDSLRKDASGRCVSLISTRVQLPHLISPGQPDPLAIAPGGSRIVAAYSPVVDRDLSETNVAVIYADGAMAGAQTVLDQLMLERRRALVDLRQDLVILARANQNPQTDWAAVAGHFRRRARAHDKLLNPPLAGGASGSPVYGVSQDRFCRWIASTIQPGSSAPASGGGVPDLISILEQVVAQLEHSKPPIGDTSGR